MALTLADYAKLTKEPLEAYFIWNMVRDAPMAELIKFRTVSSLQVIANRVRALPSVAWRNVNEGYTPNEGSTEQVWEAVYAVGGEIKFDRVFDKVSNYIQEPKKLQTDMKTKALALEFNDILINGDHASNEKSFEGLKKRASNLPSRQSVYFAGVAGDSTSVLDPVDSAGNARIFLSKFNEMRYKCNRGSVAFYVMNEGIYWGFERILALAQSGGNMLDVTKDNFDRDFLTYKGARFIDIGWKKDQSTEIITESEVANNAGTDATSIYAVSLDDQEGLSGIQLGPPEVYDPLSGGEQESTPTKLIRFEWWVGLTTFGNHALVRGRNLQSATNW